MASRIFRGRIKFFVCLILLFCASSVAAKAQQASGTSPPAVLQARQEGAALIVHLRARDGILQLHAALTGMATYHQQMLRSLTDLLANSGGAEAIRQAAQRELARLAAYEPKITEQDATRRLMGLREFDSGFPMRLERGRGPSDPTVVFPTLRNGMSALQLANSSTLRRLAADLEGILNEAEQRVRIPLEAPSAAIGRLPNMFHDLVGRSDFTEMSAEDARNAIQIYRATLTGIVERPGPNAQERSQLSNDYRNRLDRVGTEIRSELTKLDTETENIQRQMIEIAKITFSKTVSETSFYYLLGLFGAIFLLLMTAPLLYARFENEVAKSLLTGEFILQFSTVFVLSSAIIILGIGGFIKEDQLPVLLAGISGYVLGQLGRISNQRSSGE